MLPNRETPNGELLWNDKFKAPANFVSCISSSPRMKLSMFCLDYLGSRKFPMFPERYQTEDPEGRLHIRVG